MKSFFLRISFLFALAALSGLAAAGIFASAPAAAFQKQPAPDTLMLFAHQTEDPLRIVQASFSAQNTLIDAMLENQSHQKIQSFRLGWVVVKKDDVRFGKGISMDLPKDVDTTASFTIPGPENVAREDLARHPAGIVFYVAELQFEDGKRWQSEPKKIKKEAAEMVK